ncbi:MAG: 16S rRNA (guanine(527)-N(7))-methyltransferase RsmG [Candidatus Kapaibacteriales bacterium]
MEFIEFWTICSSNGIVLDELQREQIQRYAKELVYWNSKVNMISRKDEDNIWVRHIMHSLSPLKYIEVPFKSNCLDIGSGGGLPGIPLAIATDQTRMTLIDSIKKKVEMTDMFAKHTGIKQIKAIQSRVEELKLEKNERKFDFIFSRAVARTNLLIGWSKHLIAKQGTWVFLKGGDLKDELLEAQNEHPNIEIEEKPIEFFGCTWFQEQDKKLVIAKKRIK